MEKRTPKPKTYAATHGSKPVRVTIPEPDESDALTDALSDNLSPRGAAAIAACLDGFSGTNDADVDKEVAWFAEFLRDMLGKKRGFTELCKELDL